MAKHKGRSEGRVLDSSPTHLLHRVLQLALDYHADAAGPDGLTQRQYAVLAAVDGHQGLTQSDLVRATGIDRSTLAELVARMDSRGLLVREKSASDARANAVRLTEAGEVALAAGRLPAAGADERLLALLSPKKRPSFVKLLSALVAAADGETAPKKSKGKKAKRKKKAARAEGAAAT